MIGSIREKNVADEPRGRILNLRYGLILYQDLVCGRIGSAVGQPTLDCFNMRIVIDDGNEVGRDPGVGFQVRHQVVETNLHRRQRILRAKTAPAPVALSVELLDIDKAIGIEEVTRVTVVVGIEFLERFS